MGKRIFGAVAFAAVIVAAPAFADVKTGVDAWARGDFKRAVDEWRPLAIAGDADAQFNLGQAYKLGRGVPLDPALAQSWFAKAAAKGHLQAEDNYGLALFQAGKKAEARPWLEKSVARGEPRAQLVLGTMLFNGDSVPRDYPRAYALMTRASAAGLQSASQTLAQMDQYITPEDRQKGTALAQQYAAQTRAMPQPAPRQTVDRGAPPAPVARTEVPPSRPVPAPAPTKPAPVAAAKPAPIRTSGGGWRIQLGAFRDQGNAESLWNRVRGRLGGAQPFYPKAGGVTRLQAGGYASKAEAARACSAAGSPCVVVAP